MKITFEAKISKNGAKNLAIWFPKKHHDKIKDSDNKQFKIIIKSKNGKISFVSRIAKKGDDRIIWIPMFIKNVVKKIMAEKCTIIITDNF